MFSEMGRCGVFSQKLFLETGRENMIADQFLYFSEFENKNSFQKGNKTGNLCTFICHLLFAGDTSFSQMILYLLLCLLLIVKYVVLSRKLIEENSKPNPALQ